MKNPAARNSCLKMLRFFLVWLMFISVSRSDLTPEQPTTSECDTSETVISNLDLAVQLIQTARGNIPKSFGESLPTDCQDVLKGGWNDSGVYQIWPRSRILSGYIDVYCDMSSDGGGWTVIQRRGNFLRAMDYFFQDWESYKKGFGQLRKDFLLGNDNIYALSNQGLYSVRFDLKDVGGSKKYAHYDTFWIEDETRKYTLHVNGYSGDAGDSLDYHNGQKFTTKDQDNDIAERHCAEIFKGGWWYNDCRLSNMNALYHPGKDDSTADGVVWHSWKGYHESMAETEIKIRKKV